VILAGGAGARFGPKPKGLSTVAGTRIVDRVASALAAVTDRLVLVANDPAAGDWLPGVPVVADLRPGRGPLSGIHTALAHTTGPVLAVAWDMPFVATALLAEIRQCGRAGHRAVVPESAVGRLEPACAFYAGESRPAIERWLEERRSGATAFLEQSEQVHRLVVAEVERFGDPARLFFSINTMPDLEQAEAMAALRE
jgi:molybdopterin-guanine dinucleotide biosynthesis protein A